MECDAFLYDGYSVHLNTEEEAESFFAHYREQHNIGEGNTLNMRNWGQYPYAYCYNADAIHGQSGRRMDTIEFFEWSERVGLTGEIGESEQPLSFLFE